MELGLIEDIRRKMHREDILLEIKVDVNQFPDYKETSAVKLKLSSRDIYKKMIEKNPLIKDLVTRLDLRPEHES